MGLSRSTRIILLLIIDTLFFFLEIIVGYAVHSLALVADSFHMLNDVISLLVALWAIKLSRQKSTSSYTYGWQRAEVLGALVNGVFLVALCVSIFLEAIQRFVEPQVITNPRLILGVGCAGLASNIIGLFLFHEHGHAHGTPSGAERLPDEEAGHEHAEGMCEGRPPIESLDRLPLDESGPIEEILPESVVARTISVRSQHAQNVQQVHHRSASGASSALVASPHRFTSPDHRHQSRSGSRPRKFADPETSIHVLPAQNRLEIINAAEASSDEEALLESPPSGVPSERTPLLSPAPCLGLHGAKNTRSDSVSHENHIHSQPKPEKSGHHHGNLNMRGVFLHVLGDALGNIGVILTALFIWKTDFSWRFYFDPAISLFITAIILASALPLCKSASKILLQAVPKGVSLEEVKEDIMSIPGILNVHELHIWQLSDIKMIASLHIQIGFDPEMVEEGPDGRRVAGQRYMKLARAVRRCLHGYGIHSSTIQPEYNADLAVPNASGNARFSSGGASIPEMCATLRRGSQSSGEEACLIDCGDECEGGKCCGPMAVSEGHGHAH